MSDMKVVLGLHLDGKRSWKKRNAFNQLVLGPAGFLSQLELYLGLSARRPEKLQRVIHFRKVLKMLDNGHRFYSHSMNVDDFGVASELLEWRDELYLHGWSGTFNGKPLSGRLADLFEVETALSREKFSPGNGERLAKVADALRLFRTPITSIELLEPLERHPLRWRQVICRFTYRYRESFEMPEAPEGSALHALQHRLLLPEPSIANENIEPDNTLCAVTADTVLTAAYHVGRQLQERRGNVLLIDGGETVMLEQVLEAEGYPRQALQGNNDSLPALQLLPLLLRLRRIPLDVEALLTFLTLPEKLSPLDPVLSERLSHAVADFPGTGGSVWMRVLDDFGGEEGNVDELHRWIDGKKVGYDAPMPLSELKACAEVVKEFFSRKKEEEGEKENDFMFSCGFEQVSVFAAAVDALLEQGEHELGVYQVDQLLLHASNGIRGGKSREAGAVPDTAHPGAVSEPFAHVIWWWAAAPSLEKGFPWLADERSFLESEGVELPARDRLLEWQAADWLRPILAARKSCLLVLPSEGEERHPLWLKILSLMPAIPVIRIEEYFGVPEGEMRTNVSVRSLPAKRIAWDIPEGVMPAETVFSPTSLETFIDVPSRWFLDTVLRIRPSRLLEVKKGALLYGSLAHRLVEQLIVMMQMAGKEGLNDFQSWFMKSFSELVQKEGAVLLMPGGSAELESLRFRLMYALRRLYPVLQEHGTNGILAEQRMEGTLNGYKMRGRADLLLFNSNDDPLVIDMKWGRSEDRRKNLERGMHIQLLAYAAMVHERTGRWPSLAYYIIKSGRLLATGERGSIPGEPVRQKNEESSGMLWQRLTKSFDWRLDQVRQGILSVGGANDPGDPLLIPPDDGLPLIPSDDQHNPYRFLEGWEGTQ
jgi:hypothetical protein